MRQEDATHFDLVANAKETIDRAVKTMQSKANERAQKYMRKGGYPLLPKTWSEK